MDDDESADISSLGDLGNGRGATVTGLGSPLLVTVGK